MAMVVESTVNTSALAFIVKRSKNHPTPSRMESRIPIPTSCQSTVGRSELCERVGHRLAHDHQGGRCQDDEGDEERDSRLHESTTAQTGTERLDEAALALTDAAEGPGIPVESPRATSWLEPDS